MSGQFVTPEEARVDAIVFGAKEGDQPELLAIYAKTVVAQAERIAAVLELHARQDDGYCGTCVQWTPVRAASDEFTGMYALTYPCPTARTLGMTE